jgi:hypothetical protein
MAWGTKVICTDSVKKMTKTISRLRMMGSAVSSADGRFSTNRTQPVMGIGSAVHAGR